MASGDLDESEATGYASDELLFLSPLTRAFDTRPIFLHEMWTDGTRFHLRNVEKYLPLFVRALSPTFSCLPKKVQKRHDAHDA
jgi:hypothetical protein